MSSRKRFEWIFKSVVVGAALLLAAPPLTWADPPPWAPAHGYRAKQKNKQEFKARYHQYDEATYVQKSREYGITQSTCNREAVAALVGGAVGGLAGAQVGKGDGQIAAAVAGTIVGVMVGKSIGEHMDQIDQACTGQAIERAEDYQAVSWTNPDTGARYNVAPTGIYQMNGQYCRGYVTRIIIGNEIDTLENRACRQPDGTWQKVT
ncbi:MAG TPA: RT0821/Lpp0805 family surface protein [Gammaproteobacteria bacterium]|nr:RT0821/Lpp0805 family surface protein [Gammaproteobacteria bacterium]